MTDDAREQYVAEVQSGILPEHCRFGIFIEAKHQRRFTGDPAWLSGFHGSVEKLQTQFAAGISWSATGGVRSRPVASAGQSEQCTGH